MVDRKAMALYGRPTKLSNSSPNGDTRQTKSRPTLSKQEALSARVLEDDDEEDEEIAEYPEEPATPPELANDIGEEDIDGSNELFRKLSRTAELS